MTPARLRWPRRVALVGGALVLTVAVIAGVLHVRARQEWTGLLAETAADDPRWTLADMQADRPAVPPDRDGAARLVAVAARLPTKLIPTGLTVRFPRDDAPPSPTYRAALTDLFAATAPADREAARSLADFPTGRVGTPFVHTHLTVCNFLTADLNDLLDRGDRREALRAWRAMVSCGRTLAGEPGFLAALVRSNVRATAARCVGRMLGRCRWTDYDLAVMQAELTADDAHNLLLEAFRGDRAGTDELFARADSNPDLAVALVPAPFGSRFGGDTAVRIAARMPGYVQGARTAALRRANAVVAAARLPEPERWAAVDALTTGPADPMLRVQWVKRIASDLRNEQTPVRDAIVTVACERYRQRTGRRPRTLDEVVVAGLLPSGSRR